MTVLASIPDRAKTLVIVEPPKPLEDDVFSKANIEKYVPSDLTPTTNQQSLGQQLENKMGQKILQNILDGDTFKKSSIGKAANTVQKAAEQSMAIGSSETGVVHTLKFEVKAFERYAQIKYSGYFDSNLIYTSDTNSAALTLTKPLSQSTFVTFAETSPMSNFQMNPNLSFSYSF